MQAVSILQVLACVRGTINQNVCHAILPWCRKLLYSPKYKVNLPMSRSLITAFDFQESTYFVCSCGVTLPLLNPRDKHEMFT